MGIPTDIEIASAASLRPPVEIAGRLGIPEEFVEPYGRSVAKIDLACLTAPGQPTQQRAKYVVISAVTPTPLGEGKTTTAVGLADGLARIGRNVAVTLRQPSMGPTFGIKGGAAGGGYSQVVPMDKLNLHLTGDFHAITAAHNLLAAIVDNHLHHGNQLQIDPHNITWRRVLDVNDRALRNLVVGLGSKVDGVPRQSGFDITAASEVMVLLSLATSLEDLRERLRRIVIGYSYAGRPITADDLGAAGAMAVILQDALNPNLLQTLEGTPALIHCGPFGNIATGNSSIVADLVATRRADIVLTEAGFGADMGCERFMNVKCRVSGLRPDAAVLVVTIRALKTHSGRFDVKAGKPLPPEMLEENPDDVRAGLPNLIKHIEIVNTFGVSPVVAINAFPSDYASEHQVVIDAAERLGIDVAVTRHVAEGGAGAEALAEALLKALDRPTNFRFTYELDAPLVDKIDAVARKVYGAEGIDVLPAAASALAAYEKLGFGALPVVIAKTHLSVSSDPKLLGAPTGWRLPVREVRAAAGAGYVYAICGEMRTMPGLSSHPNAERIDLTPDGAIIGLS
ncbi:MAG TPA: formate--tetrahydrofolate ligase [Tetrasphaera sp.]|uniref:formate--tetrahydrofolate ligase n=1 Tax=Nostocoides sp. TaxID=1917966 RepID=UPI002CF66C22|nr:formate--tetrahydrofolate ligase [Tetrasphaera sp.]HNQ07746.1 formate--tetrahydrofolate ligase [Tetrasphaera sp.]